MATTVSEARTRGRDAVLDDLAYYNHRARRMTRAHQDWPLAHSILDELLRELGY